LNKLRTYFLVGLTLAIPSGYGLYRIVFFSLPNLSERWLFFFLLAILVCGLTLPIYAAINKYFLAAKQIIPTTVVRESLATALLIEILLWFQIGRMLTSTIIFLCVGGFLLAEIVLRTRDNVSHRPGIDDLENQ